ncbi:MAG TPA: ester cyclase [Steroidobacteraceae bacterium]|nr:ester cyclase [Steroidobacteraceae bacterium]
MAAKRKSTARKTAPRKPVPRKKAVRKPAAGAQLAANKKLVLAFYEQIIGRKDFDAARRYMGATYRQHAPYAADGPDGLRAWLAGFKSAFPNHRYEVKRVIAEGPYVMLHLHGMGGPNPHGESVVDIFRVENGKVVEHWDIIQAIPDTADNANSMF